MKMESESFEDTLKCGLGWLQNGLVGKFQESMYFWPQKEAKAMEYVIQAVKISFQPEIFSKFFFAGSSKI